MPTSALPCKICQTRRPRRYCPGVSGDICPICCGTEREVTVNCPLDCIYLREARAREKHPEVDPRQFPHPDIKVTEDFLRRNEPILILIAGALAKASLETRGVLDNDTREALDSLVQTYRTLQSGLYYESRPDNALAAGLQRDVQAKIDEIRNRLTETGQTLRDADVLGVLAFLQRLEIQHNNGRPKGRAFIHFLQQFFPSPHGPSPHGPAREGDSGLIVTG